MKIGVTNKGVLIAEMALHAGLSYKQAADALDIFCRVIAYEMELNGEVRITGFGTFSVRHHAQRRGRNPKTGEPITIPARRTVKFKAGKMLRDHLT